MFVVLETRYPYKDAESLMSCCAVYGPFDTVDEARVWRDKLNVQVRPEDGQIFNGWNVYKVTDPGCWSPVYNDIVDHSGEGGGPGGVDKIALRKRVGPAGKHGPGIIPSEGSQVEK